MAEILTVDGISLRGQGFGAATRTGRYGIPPRRGDNLYLPGADGANFVVNKPFEEGVGALAVWAIGASTDGNGRLVIPPTIEGRRQQFETNMQTLMRLFTRGHRLSEIRAEQADGTIRRAYVEWKEWDDPEVQAGGTRAEWAIAYVIPGVWWEDENETTQSATAGATLPKTLNLTSFSGMTGVIDDAILTVTGPITNPRITDSETGAWVQYTGTVSAGASWVVDVKAATSKIGSSSVMGTTTHAGGYKLLTIPNCYQNTNTPRLVLSGSAGSTATNFSVQARRKWVHG